MTFLAIFDDEPVSDAALRAAVTAANRSSPAFFKDPLALVPPIWIVDEAAFRANEEKIRRLSGPGIVIVDLFYQDLKVTNRKLYSDRSVYQSVDGALRELGVINRQIYAGGLYLAALALSNDDWRGVLCIGSSEGAPRTADKVLRTLFADTRERSWNLLTGGLRSGVEVLVKDAASIYANRFGDLAARLYPARTEKWFMDDTTAGILPHRFGGADDPEYIRLLVLYLADLWRVPRDEPAAWWAALARDERIAFHESLKRIVGYCAAADERQSDSRRDLRGPDLGSLVVVAAACCPAPMTWLSRIRWTRGSPKVAADRARPIVTEFSRFATAAFEDETKETPTTTIRDVGLTRHSLALFLEFDVTEIRTSMRSDKEPTNNVAGPLWRLGKLMAPGIVVSVEDNEIRFHS